MSKNFAICRTEKIHDWSSVKGRAGHNERATPPTHRWEGEGKPPNWVSSKPVYLVGGPGFAANWQNQVQGMKLRKLKDDQRHVLARELFLGASPEFFADASRADVDAWAAASVDWAKQRFGAERVGQAVMHLDEQTPHLHIFLLPIKHTKQGPTLSDRVLGLAGSKHDLSKLQTEYADAMKPLGLRRGLEGSTATHTKTKDWRRMMSAPMVVPRVRWDKVPSPGFGDRFDLPNYAQRASKVAYRGIEQHHASMIKQAQTAQTSRKERDKALGKLARAREALAVMADALGAILGLGRPFDIARDLPALKALMAKIKPKTPAPLAPPPATPAATPTPARREAVAGGPADPQRRPRA